MKYYHIIINILVIIITGSHHHLLNGCICQFVKWQIRPFNTTVAINASLNAETLNSAIQVYYTCLTHPPEVAPR